MGFTYKKPKIVPGNVSVAKQQEFLETYQNLKQEKTVYIFQMQLTLLTIPSYPMGGSKKEKKNDVYSKSNTGRKRLNLLGALSIGNKQAVVIECKTVHSQASIDLLETIKQKQPHGKVYMVLDNAKYHHARLVKNWFLNHPRFKPIFLPPYSPNLNLIERLWRFFHKKVTNNHYFATFKEFQKATIQFFQNLGVYKQQLDTLLTEKFQTLPLVANLS